MTLAMAYVQEGRAHIRTCGRQLCVDLCYVGVRIDKSLERRDEGKEEHEYRP